MIRYKYKAINENGRPVNGVLSAINEIDLHNQLFAAGLELIRCSELNKKGGLSSLSFSKISMRDMIQVFLHLNQMQSAGVSILDALKDVREAVDSLKLRDILSEIHRAVSEGSSFSESLAAHPKIFSSLTVSLVQAGEETGDMPTAYKQLIAYLKWTDAMQAKIRKATRYPIFVLIVVFITIFVMLGVVVPKIIEFIVQIGQELPIYTIALINTSNFLQHYWLYVLTTPVLLLICYKFMRRTSAVFAYKADVLKLKMPVFGSIIRKTNIARFSRTFGVLYSSGIDVVSALRAARSTATNLAMISSLQTVESQIQAGSSLSESFGATGEFPNMVVKMIRVGEESGDLEPILNQICEFYSDDIDEEVQKLITSIEPTLTGIMGVIILWIAAAVFGPIYNSFGSMEM